MYLVKAQNQKTNQVEIYYCSDSVPLKEFKESLSWIKDGWERNWERVNREIIEVQENVIPTFRNEMKYITTVNENSIKEIFFFEKRISTVLSPAITAFMACLVRIARCFFIHLVKMIITLQILFRLW